MNCKFCNSAKALRVSQSKDRWYFRLFLSKCLRCRTCGYSFFAPMWQRIVRSTASSRVPQHQRREECVPEHREERRAA